MRELRRDNAFLEDERRKEKEEKDAEYAKKIGAITQMLQQQEHEVIQKRYLLIYLHIHTHLHVEPYTHFHSHFFFLLGESSRKRNKENEEKICSLRCIPSFFFQKKIKIKKLQLFFLFQLFLGRRGGEI